MKILLPNQNYAENMTFSVENEVTNYEIKRAFSYDMDEYAKITPGSYVFMDFTSTNSGTPGLLLLAETYNAAPILVTDDNAGFASATTLNISASYGDTLQLREYANNPGERYFRLDLNSVSTEEIKNIIYGRVYNLPEGRLEDNEMVSSYYKSKVFSTLDGTVKYSGVLTHIRNKTSINFEYLNSTDKDMLLNIYLYSKGTLPVWFIEDSSDESTWMQVMMKTINIREPFAGYFKVSISMEEL